MGRWNRRYFPRGNRRNRYKDYDWSPPRESYQDPEFTTWQDNVPLWEKKFCYQSGVAWEKVLNHKNCHEWYTNVIDWDDLAGKQAFHQAKQVYWAKINNLPCDLEIPGPDLYIDEIDWHTHIDPELARDLDRAFFHADDDDTQSRSQGTKPKPTSISGWEDTKKTNDNNYNPWEAGGAKKPANNIGNPWNKATGWDHGHDEEAKNKDNPWNKAAGWGDAWDGGANKEANNDNSWNRTSGWGDAWDEGTKETTNNDNPWNKATGWNNAWDGAQRPANSGNSWGKATPWVPLNDSRDGGAKYPAKNWNCPAASCNTWGSGCSKVHESKPHNVSGPSNVSSHSNRKTWRQCGNNGWADSGVSSRGNSGHIEAGNSRSSYHTGSNSRYPHSSGQKGASREAGSFGGQKRWDQSHDSNMRWSQKGHGETYAGPRKREGSSQYLDGHRGSRLRYVDQTSQRYEG